MTFAPSPNLALVRASRMVPPTPRPVADWWSFANCVGRLVEVSEAVAAGALSWTARIIVEAQACCEPVVWVAGTESIFFPPDLVEVGVQLDNLPVVWASAAAKALDALELLLRSNAFGLVIGDLGSDWRLSNAALGRLVKLAECQAAAVFLLTTKAAEETSIGSMVSLRVHVSRPDSEPLSSEIRVLKDKEHQSGRFRREVHHGPSGLY